MRLMLSLIFLGMALPLGSAAMSEGSGPSEPNVDEMRDNQSLGRMTHQQRQRARTEQAVVRKIDLARRTGQIGGYEYEFGPPHYPIKVTMLGSNAGAVELLEPGMKVEVVYVDKGFARIPLSIKQLPDDAEVEH